MTVDLAYQEFGEGEPVVILHGLFGSGTNWRTPARRLRARHRVLLVDLRNHGRSPHARDMSYAVLAGDVLALLDRCNLSRATLIGHSMGGKTAMRLALQAPQRVSCICVVDIAPVAYRHDHDSLVAAMRSVDLARVERRGDAEAQLYATVHDPSVRAFLLQNLISANGAYDWRIDLDAIEAGMGDLLGFHAPPGDPSYPGRCLFVRGEHSGYVRPEHRDTIRTFFPSAEIVTVAGAGHWLHAERPAEMLSLIEGFIDSDASG